MSYKLSIQKIFSLITKTASSIQKFSTSVIHHRNWIYDLKKPSQCISIHKKGFLKKQSVRNPIAVEYKYISTFILSSTIFTAFVLTSLFLIQTSKTQTLLTLIIFLDVILFLLTIISLKHLDKIKFSLLKFFFLIFNFLLLITLILRFSLLIIKVFY